MANKQTGLIILSCLWLLHSVFCQTNVDNVKSTPNTNCSNPNCSCCLETANCVTTIGNCGGQCRNGYHGGRCLNNCPSNCVACKDRDNPNNDPSYFGFANCTSCKPGYYSTTDYNQCQFECYDNCAICTSAADCTSCNNGFYQANSKCLPCATGCDCSSDGICTQCKDGYYNSNIGNNNINCTACSHGCQNTCVKDSGSCSPCRLHFSGDKCDSCMNGWFGNECQQKCNSLCASCYSYNECTSCFVGYALQGTTCQICKTGCAVCPSIDTCSQCTDGYFMTIAEKKCTECSNGCANGCNKSTGSCSCMAGFTGEKCDYCAPNFQPYPNCSECASQYHGTYCNMSCPSNCKNKTCYKDSGACKNGCDGNFTGQDCNTCRVGFYGMDCNQFCPENCLDGTCDQSNGNCHNCKSNYMGNLCNSCATGNYGVDCDKECPLNCNSTCQQISGNCDSCNDGFTGDKCCLNGPGCQTCSSKFICSICVAGFHGANCDKICPANCADNICDMVNGTCRTCADGFNGDNCTLASTETTAYSSVPIGAVAGGVIGGIVVLIAIGVFLLIFFKRRSIKSKKGPSTMARSDNLTTARVYVNDAAIISAPKETSTYDTVANTYDTIRDMEPPSLGAFLNNAEAKPITTGTPEAFKNLDATVKSDTTIKLDKSVIPDKQGKPEMAVKPVKDIRTTKSPTTTQKMALKSVKPIKTAKANNTPQCHVARMNHGPSYDSFEDEDDNDYYNSEASPEKGVHVSELASYVDKKDSDFFNNEYAKLPKGLVKSTDAALLDQNLNKNRYNAIYPYDETRVVLAGPGSDFINACYIEGYRKKRRYIASLGPIAKATEGFKTFWRMVWQEKTEKIVMVTNLMESGGMKCEQYWPDKNVTLVNGDVKVTCHSEDVYAEYTVRSFTVRKKKEQRSLHHIHYTAWPDKGVPDDVTSLVEFRNKVNSTKTTLRGPIIVHCSAGVGRTGTYIALDILTLKGERTGFVDIFECVSKLRQQRTCMVQTAEQYEYLHRALVHTLTFESEAIPADHFMAYTASLRDDIFDRLSHCTEKISTEEMEAIDRNKAYSGYNRPGADIPGDNNRPRLYYGRTTEDNDYINALFVNSFKRKNQFILTQTPLPNTVDDFLTLVVQENCCCIVSMDAADLIDKTIGTYLPPDNQTLTTDTYEVRIKKLDSNHIFSHRTLTITSKNTSSTVTVQHFRCINWSDNDKTPKSPSEFLTFVKQIQKVADETTQFSPIIIHCRTGSERSALPCVVLSLLQKIEIEHEVSVINTVRQVKVRRSKSIPNKEQYKFCHECVSAYLQTFDIYSNFS